MLCIPNKPQIVNFINIFTKTSTPNYLIEKFKMKIKFKMFNEETYNIKYITGLLKQK